MWKKLFARWETFHKIIIRKEIVSIEVAFPIDYNTTTIISVTLHLKTSSSNSEKNRMPSITQPFKNIKNSYMNR